MARTTVEDCLKFCPNHFELTLRAAWRARKMAMSGDRGLVDHDDDKPIVVSLLEIREGHHLLPEADDEPAEEAATGDEEEHGEIVDRDESSPVSDPVQTAEETAG